MGGEGGEQTAKSATRPQLQRPRASTDRRRRRDGRRPRSPSLPALRPDTARAAGVFAANTAREWGGVRRTEGRHAEDDGEKQTTRRHDAARAFPRRAAQSRGGSQGLSPPAPSASASRPGMGGLRPRPRLSLHSSDRAPRVSDARTAAAARLRSRRRSSRRCGGRRWSCRRRICSGSGARAAATSVSQCVRSEILDAPHVVISLHGRRRSAARGGRPGHAGVARGGPGARAPVTLDVRRPGRSRDRRARVRRHQGGRATDRPLTGPPTTRDSRCLRVTPPTTTLLMYREPIHRRAKPTRAPTRPPTDLGSTFVSSGASSKLSSTHAEILCIFIRRGDQRTTMPRVAMARVARPIPARVDVPAARRRRRATERRRARATAAVRSRERRAPRRAGRDGGAGGSREPQGSRAGVVDGCPRSKPRKARAGAVGREGRARSGDLERRGESRLPRRTARRVPTIARLAAFRVEGREGAAALPRTPRPPPTLTHRDLPTSETSSASPSKRAT